MAALGSEALLEYPADFAYSHHLKQGKQHATLDTLGNKRQTALKQILSSSFSRSHSPSLKHTLFSSRPLIFKSCLALHGMSVQSAQNPQSQPLNVCSCHRTSHTGVDYLIATY
eukprot:1161779-Pelagomonas_calceolata.AAC.9